MQSNCTSLACLVLTFLVLVVCLCALSLGQIAVGASGETLYVQSDAAIVRANPSDESEAILTLSKGDKVLEFRRQGGWVKVSIFGRIGMEGWIPEKYLSQEQPGTAPSGSTEQAPETKPAKQDTGEVARPKLARFVLEIDFPMVRKIRANCITVIGKEPKRINRYSHPPTRLAYSAEAISCVVARAPGLSRVIFDVSLWKDGQRIVEFEGSAASVRLRSRGPWGERSAVKHGSLLLSPWKQARSWKHTR